MTINQMEFRNMTEAWEGINEFLATQEKIILKSGGGNAGPELLSYNNIIRIKRARLNPDFDFGKVLGYSIKKWSSLINNYVDFNFLNILRTEIGIREEKKAKNYNLAYHFENHHGSGKDCLISLTFSRRLYSERPIVSFNIRTSEVTRRLIFDLLLVQRIIEYVYGHNRAELYIYIPAMFLTAESFCLYDNVKPILPILRKARVDNKGWGKFQRRIVKTYKEFSKVDRTTVKYKTNLRSIDQIQKDENGDPISGVKSMFLSEMVLPIHQSTYPIEALSPNARRKFNRKPRIR